MLIQRFKRTIFTLLKLALVVFLITWLVRNDSLDFSKLSIMLTSVYLPVCLLAVGMTLVTACERWRTLFSSQNLNMSFYNAMKMTLIGVFFNFSLPGGVGGDFVRGYYIAKKNHNAKTKSVVSVLVDRLMGFYSMVVVALMALLMYSQNHTLGTELQTVLFAILLLFSAFSLCWFLVLSKTVYKKKIVFFILKKIPKNTALIRTYESFAGYRDAKWAFTKAFALSIASQFFTIIFFIFAGKALGYTISTEAYFSLVPVGLILSAMPISIGGVGVGQAAFLFLFSLVAPEQTQVGPMTVTVFQIILFLYGLVGAYYYIAIRKTMGEVPAES